MWARRVLASVLPVLSVIRMSPGSAPVRTGQLSGIEGFPKQVSDAKALNPNGLGRQHPTRFCWLAWRGCGEQHRDTRPRVQAMYSLCATYVLAIAPEVDRINLGSNSQHIGST